MHQCGSLDEARITELFGRGWPDALHRVIPNAAVRRAGAAQSKPLSPQSPCLDDPPEVLDGRPLYASDRIAELTDVRPAAELAASLTP